MATDSLGAPLGNKPSKKWLALRIPLGWIGGGLTSALLATLVLWVVVVDDPFGGEPVAVIALERPAPGVRKKDVEVVDIRRSLPSSQEQAEAAGTSDAAQTRPEIKFTDADLTEDGGGQPLSTMPLDRLTEAGPHGPLPKIAEDGARPLDLYAAPVARAAVDMPKVVLIVTGLGLSQTGTQEAIRSLPAGVTFAFAPYGSSLVRWVRNARQDGHELLLQMPLEPFDFPDNDPGPHTLLTKLSETQNLDRLNWLLARITNYVGVINYMGARFTATPESLAPVLSALSARGLMYMDDGSSSRSVAETMAKGAGVPFAKADVTIDYVASPEEIDAKLLQLEALSRSQGLAIGVASALPVSIERIAEWTRDLEARGIVLTPPSFIARSGAS
ncbi:MAG: divergent polysaccharide deacetylase family protein [Pseudomonadota bacterium]